MFSTSREADQPDNTIDLLDIMNRGHILLVDLQHGGAVDEAATDLLGKIILRYLFLLMNHRKPYALPGSIEKKFNPFFVYVDEAHRYVTDDVEGLLTQSRKFGIGVTLAHQYLGQLGKPGDKIYEAVRNSTEAKVVFRVKAPEEAQALALDVLRLTLELPVQASIRPTQVGYTIGKLASESYSVHEGEGVSEAIHAAEANGQGRTDMQHWVSARGWIKGIMRGSGSASSIGSGFSSGASSSFNSMTSTSYTYDPNTQTFIMANLPLGMSVGAADGSSQALMSRSTRSRRDISRRVATGRDSCRTGNASSSAANCLTTGPSCYARPVATGRDRERASGHGNACSDPKSPTRSSDDTRHVATGRDRSSRDRGDVALCRAARAPARSCPR